MSRSEKPFVVHWCKNKKCTATWLDRDETNVSSRPAQHKYCIDCQVFGGFTNQKDPDKVARGKEMARLQREKRNKYKCLDDL
jgi:hypothetical protein